METKRNFSPLLRIFVFLCCMALLAAAAAIGLYYYVFSIPEPEGRSLAGWPNRFTENFSVWIENEGGEPRIRDTGLERLDEYGLWLQILDGSGREIFSYHKPENYPASYSASELIGFGTGGYDGVSTVFVSGCEASGEAWSYLIGFPYAVGKHMLYYNGEAVGRLSPVFRGAAALVFCAAAALFLVYGFWLTRQMGKIAKGIGDVSRRAYRPLPEKGVFGGVCAALNQMDGEIRHSDRLKEDTERTRREWIANITHDLKTPLSPVKGYAELLADGGPADARTVREYGSIILKNVEHAEKLINDLTLTYRLDSGAFPFHPRQVRLVRYLRESVIDIVNDPAFAGRDTAFESPPSELVVSIDPALFRRAVQNLIVNALVHNPPETKVTVSVAAEKEGGVCISVRDNGVGLSEEEQSRLFNRYYRGTNTGEKPEGSGLGLAIAKQIIVLHGGDITVKSSPGEGTEFRVFLPAN